MTPRVPMWQSLFGTLDHPAFLPAVVVLLGAWAVALGTGARLAWTAWADRTPQQTRFVGTVAGIALAAVVLRAWWVPATPEMRWRLVYAYDAADGWGLADIRKYGLGLPLWMRGAVLALGRRVEVPFAVNAVVGGLSVVPLAGLARAVGADRVTATACAAALAMLPLHAWFSHTDGPLPLAIAWALVALWAVARAADDGPDRDLWLALAAAALVSTAQFRTEAVLVCGMGVLLALARTPGFPWRRRGPWVAVAAVVLGLVPHARLVVPAVLEEMATRAALRPEVGSQPPITPLHWAVLDPTMSSWALIGLATLGLAAGPVSWRVRGWAVLGLVGFGLLVPFNHPTETAYTVARYQALTLPFAALLAGLGAGRLLGWAPSRGRGAVALALTGLVAVDLPKGTRETVMLHELRFVREHLRRIPEPCTVVTWLSTDDTVLYPPRWLSRVRVRDHRWVDLARSDAPLHPREGCVVYYRPGVCMTHYEPRRHDLGLRYPVCADFEARWALQPLAEATFPSDPVGPMGLANRWPGEPVAVGLYRVTGRQVGDRSPAGPDDGATPGAGADADGAGR